MYIQYENGKFTAAASAEHAVVEILAPVYLDEAGNICWKPQRTEVSGIRTIRCS